MADLDELRDLLTSRRLDLDQVLQLAVDEVAERLTAQRGTLYLVDHARGELVSRAAILPEIREIRLRPGEGVAGQVASTGELLNVVRGRDDPRWADHVDLSTGFRTTSLLAAPLVHNDAIIGVLQVLNKRDADRFDETDERSLQTLARRMSTLLATSSLASQLHPSSRQPLDFHFNHIVGSSPGMLASYRAVSRVAPTSVTVLIRGETGTGKELLARAVHDNSDRRDRPFVKVDCAALPANLIENELFGHARGAYTGADRSTAGHVAAAEGGTLFLDEIGELPLEVQGRLLRLLQDHTYLPVGATTPRPADVRFVAATHRHLEDAVERGQFRRDLYYRLRVVELRLPPLRERGATDLDRLIDHFLFELARKHERPRSVLTRGARIQLHNHSWPGNVRELEHTLESGLLLSVGSQIDAIDLSLGPAQLRTGDFRAGLQRLEQVERAYVRWALDRCGGNKTSAAKTLGIGRNTLARKLDS